MELYVTNCCTMYINYTRSRKTNNVDCRLI